MEENKSALVLPDRFHQSIVRAAGESKLAIVEIAIRPRRGCDDLVRSASRLDHKAVGKTGFRQSAARIKERIRAAWLQDERRKLHAQVGRAGVNGQLGG